MTFIDTADQYYYDAAGMLIRVEHVSIQGHHCTAGDTARPAEDTACTNTFHTTMCAPP